MKQAAIFVLTLMPLLAIQPGTAATPRSAAAAPRSTATAEDDAIEATLRFQMQQLADERGRRIFYLAYGLAEPSAPTEAFMGRFSSSASRVRKFDRDEFDLARLKTEMGIVIGTYGVRKMGVAAYRVEGYHFIAPGEAEGFVCDVEAKKVGQSAVTGCQKTWVA